MTSPGIVGQKTGAHEARNWSCGYEKSPYAGAPNASQTGDSNTEILKSQSTQKPSGPGMLAGFKFPNSSKKQITSKINIKQGSMTNLFCQKQKGQKQKQKTGSQPPININLNLSVNFNVNFDVAGKS